MRRIGILLASLGLILVIGVGLLVLRALQSIGEEEELRHEVVASRLFDELERELTGLLHREEERSFLEYRSLFVPEGQVPGNPSLSVSPLAAGPTDPYVVGWYQIEPDGALNLPWRPRPFEQEYATTNALVLGKDGPGLSDAEQTIETLAEPLLQPVRDAWNARLDEADADSDDSAETGKAADGPPAVQSPKRDPAPAKTPLPTARATDEPSPEGAKDDAAAPAGGELELATTAATITSEAGGGEEGDATGRVEEDERRTVEQSARRDGDEARAQRELEVAVERSDEDSGDDKESEAAAEAQQRYRDEADAPGADSAPAVVVATSSPGPTSTSGIGRKRKKQMPKGNSDRDVLESLNRGSRGRQAGTKSSAYSSDSADLFKNDQEVGTVQGEVAFEPTPDELPELLAQVSEESAEPDGEPVGNADLDGVAADGGALEAGYTGRAPGADGEGAQADAGREGAPESESEPAPVANPVATPAEEDVAPPPKPRSQRRAAKPKAEPSPTPSEPVELLVTVSPFSSYRPDAAHLVLHRDVHVGEDRYVQGLVVRLPELVEHLHDRVVGTDIEDSVQISWPDIGIETGEPVEPRFGFEHSFAEPFGSVTAAAALGTLPREGRDPRSWVVFLALLLGVVGTLGFAGVYRSTAVVVHFAERRNNFVAAVTHELKTPLTAIRMYAEILQEGMVASDAKRQEYYGTITTESDRLGRLINNVLELSNLEKGSRAMRLEVGSIATVLDEVAKVLGPHARDRGFTLVTEVPDDLPSARFDRDALLQVVINLVDNAIKFSADSDDKRILLSANEGSITIRDHGPGVPPAQLTRIFQPFFRGERELVRNTKGTGIGLALVRGLVEEMGGRVIARNHPSGGFEVQIAL